MVKIYLYSAHLGRIRENQLFNRIKKKSSILKRSMSPVFIDLELSDEGQPFSMYHLSLSRHVQTTKYSPPDGYKLFINVIGTE